jgi:hypothetical protein
LDGLNPGLRSYGKVVYAFGTLPILGYFIICVKVLGYSSSVPTSGVGGVLDRTPWNEFFTDTKVRPFESLVFWLTCIESTGVTVYSRDTRYEFACFPPFTLFNGTLKTKEPDRDLLT